VTNLADQRGSEDQARKELEKAAHGKRKGVDTKQINLVSTRDTGVNLESLNKASFIIEYAPEVTREILTRSEKAQVLGNFWLGQREANRTSRQAKGSASNHHREQPQVLGIWHDILPERDRTSRAAARGWPRSSSQGAG
jgi:hypothetical protein